MRVTRSRELVAEGHSPSAVARVAQISRQAIYRVPKRAPAAAARRAGPPACEGDAAIIEVAEANQTDGYRMVCALVTRKLGRAINRKRVLRVMRERRLIERRRRLDRPPHRVLSGDAPEQALASGHDLGLGRRAPAG